MADVCGGTGEGSEGGAADREVSPSHAAAESTAAPDAAADAAAAAAAAADEDTDDTAAAAATAAAADALSSIEGEIEKAKQRMPDGLVTDPEWSKLSREEKLAKLAAPKYFIRGEEKYAKYARCAGKLMLYDKQVTPCEDGESPDIVTFGGFARSPMLTSRDVQVEGLVTSMMGIHVKKVAHVKSNRTPMVFLYAEEKPSSNHTPGMVVGVCYNVTTATTIEVLATRLEDANIIDDLELAKKQDAAKALELLWKSKVRGLVRPKRTVPEKPVKPRATEGKKNPAKANAVGKPAKKSRPEPAKTPKLTKADLRERYPSANKVKKGVYKNTEHIKEALAVLGQSTDGPLPALKERLIVALGLSKAPPDAAPDAMPNAAPDAEPRAAPDAAPDADADDSESNPPPTKKPKPPPAKKPAPPPRQNPWVRWVDSGTGDPFWQNTITKEVTWTNPNASCPDSAGNAPISVSHSAAMGDTRGAVVACDTRLPSRAGGCTEGLDVLGALGGSGLHPGLFAGANITLVAAGAYAAGCNVHQYAGRDDRQSGPSATGQPGQHRASHAQSQGIMPQNLGPGIDHLMTPWHQPHGCGVSDPRIR